MQDQFIHKVDRMPQSLDGEWELVVDSGRRKEITKHHSATHLVHAALRSVLGDHVAQKGSLVTEDHLRFDFSHFEAVNPSQLDKIEEIVNERIQMNIAKQEDRDVPIDEARKRGAMMLFGEKYGEKVRVITFDPDYSVELCGGIHVDATGEIGYFRFLHESSVAAGIRRITAVTGKSADQNLRSEKHLLHNIGQLAGQTDDITDYFEKLISERKSLEKELERLKTEAVAQELTSILNAPKAVLGVDLHVGELVGADMNMLKQMGYEALNRKPKANVTVLGSKEAYAVKVYRLAAVTDDLIKEKGLKAGALVGKIARLVGGGGGGQPNLATAGGRNPEALEDALHKVAPILETELS
jgi:alanyl-tRNA synthetase